MGSDDLKPGPEITAPPHYNQHPSGVECKELAAHLTWTLGNCLKYAWRARHTGHEQKDLLKARESLYIHVEENIRHLFRTGDEADIWYAKMDRVIDAEKTPLMQQFFKDFATYISFDNSDNFAILLATLEQMIEEAKPMGTGE